MGEACPKCNSARSSLPCAYPGECGLNVDRLRAELEQASSMLEIHGVTKKRARNVANGIDVLTTRYRREIFGLNGELERSQARVRELEKAIRSMVYWHKPDGVWRVGIIGDCQAPDEVQHALANSDKEN